MSERWTHNICDACWAKLMQGRTPVKLRDPGVEACCYCGGLTTSGIFIRWDPERLHCKGVHLEAGHKPLPVGE
jgi:hypothetical protein